MPARHFLHSIFLLSLRLILVIGVSVVSFATPIPSFAAPIAKPQIENSELFTPIPNAPTKPMGVSAVGGLTGAQLSYAQATGKVRFMRLSAAHATQLAAELAQQARSLQAHPNRTSASATAQAFLQRYGAAFGVNDPINQLQFQTEQTDGLGLTHVRYQQVHRGVPVFAAELNVHLNNVGEVQVINGVVLPDLTIDVHPRIDPTAAERIALETVQNAPAAAHDQPAAQALTDDPAVDPMHVQLQSQHSLLNLVVRHVRLYIYRTKLGADQPGETYLAYEVEVADSVGSSAREFVYINALNGKVIDRERAIDNALNRQIYNQSYTAPNLLWTEGNLLPFSGATVTETLNVNNIITASGHSYNLFKNAFGRDSYDASGAIMRSVNNDPSIACPNANWNGITTNYCDGITADDVVAHEWAHAYTENTHGLLYRWQPGALNEAYSDIWGETIDRLNSFATDSPDVARTDNMCSLYKLGAPIVTVSAPITVTGAYAAGGATFGPKPGPIGITNTVVMAAPADGCTALSNAVSIAGKIALVDRGTCAFTVKALNAQAAGAIGVIIANNVAGSTPPGMSGTDASITIPVVSIIQSVGTAIKTQLTNNEMVTANLRNQTSGTDNSYRWLMGEDATAFGGAIRDMWNPTCYNHAGKVSDTQYTCTFAPDTGGVHSNSGIPNHAFALLVDGGTYNSQTITGIGLTKAAHIYWRAQSVYQTSITDFADHADALEQSCTDLIGQPLNALNTAATGPSVFGQTISSTDCQQLGAVLTAVEMRSEPVQCNFQPMLAKNTPNICAVGTSPVTLYSHNFESNPGSTWAITTIMSDVTTVLPTPIVWTWTNTATLPGGRAGSAFFADNTADLSYACLPGSDVSREMLLTSPSITLTTGMSHVLTFNHYVASEAKYDGGLLFISVNGAAFTQVADSDLAFNSYNDLLNGVNSSNPRNNAFAFTGSDDGSLKGSWGQSQVNLVNYASPGDVIQLRWNFATDGCNGTLGWWVDDPTVQYCALASHIELSASDEVLDAQQTIVVTATVLDAQNAPLSGIALTGTVTPNVLGTLGMFTNTNLAGQSVSTFSANSLAGSSMLLIGNGAITGTLPVTVAGVCLATSDNGATVFESIDASAVQQAVNVAGLGAIVKVAGYCAGVQAVAGLTQTVYISQALLLMGGYTRSNWIVSNPISNLTVLDAQKQGRVVYGSGMPVALANLSVINGDTDTDGGGIYGPRISLQNVALHNNTAGENGGAIYATGIVALASSSVISNSAGSSGGAVYASQDVALIKTSVISNAAVLSGGGLHARGTVTLTSSTFDANHVETGGGGAVYLNDPTEVARMTVTNTNFTNNRAEQAYGGAIDVDAANAITIKNSSFSGNLAQDGGALDSDALFPVLVQNSVFTGNIATVYEGGALWVDGALTIQGSRFVGNRAAKQGGALANWGDQLIISQSQFVTNVATSGGAVLFAGDSAILANNLFAHNVATNTVGQALHLDAAGATQVLHNTIVSGTLASGSAIYVRSGDVGITNTIVASHTIGISQTALGRVTSQSNLFDHATVSHTSAGGVFTLSNNLTGDAGFVNAAAGDYHLRAHALAVERGVATGVLDDFEGQPRPQQFAPDIGMDESPYALDIDLAISMQVYSDTAVAGQRVTYTLVLSNVGSDGTTDVVITDIWPVELTEVVSSTSAGMMVLSDQSWRVPMFVAGGQHMITISGRISPTLVVTATPLVITNTAVIASPADTVSTTNNSASKAISITSLSTAISGLQGSSDAPTALGNITHYTASVQAGSDVVYTWHFGDGTTGSGITTSHMYSDTDIYTATVTATNDLGSISTNVLVTVTNPVAPPPVAPSGLSISGPSSGKVGQQLTFTATLLVGTNIGFTWAVSKTSLAALAPEQITLSTQVFRYPFAAAGNYTVTVKASNSSGSIDYGLPILIAPQTPAIVPRIFIPMARR